MNRRSPNTKPSGMRKIDQEREAVQEVKGQLSHLERSIKHETKALADAAEVVLHHRQAQDILQHLAKAVQQQAHRKISEVVSSCLEAVFDDPYQFHIEFERKRGKTEASLRFKRRKLEVDPLTATGGGVVDVAAFALRIACLVLSRPRLSPVVVLDEPFKFVSAKYRDNVRMMLEQLSSEMKLQIIMVTHIRELETGNVIEL